MSHDSALATFIGGLLICLILSYIIWCGYNDKKTFFLDLIDAIPGGGFFAYVFFVSGPILLIMGLVFYFSPEEPPRDPEEARWRSYSLNKERRDDASERAQKALKNGNEGEARAWVEKAQESQDKMDRKR